MYKHGGGGAAVKTNNTRNKTTSGQFISPPPFFFYHLSSGPEVYYLLRNLRLGFKEADPPFLMRKSFEFTGLSIKFEAHGWENFVAFYILSIVMFFFFFIIPEILHSELKVISNFPPLS